MDKISKAQRSDNMSRITSKNTTPELIVRKLLYKQGYRFRLHRRDLPGKPDIVLPAFKIAVFVHGCFWHQHNVVKCADGRMPKSNKGYWVAKLLANVARDKKHNRVLRKMGWSVITIWDCNTRQPERVLRKLMSVISKRERTS